MHQQDENGKTTGMVAQNEIRGCVDRHRKLHEWVADVTTRHPLSEGYTWLLITENDPKFEFAVDDDVGEYIVGSTRNWEM